MVFQVIVNILGGGLARAHGQNYRGAAGEDVAAGPSSLVPAPKYGNKNWLSEFVCRNNGDKIRQELFLSADYMTGTPCPGFSGLITLWFS